MKILNKLIGAIYCSSYIIILTILSLSKMVEYATKKKMFLSNIEYGLIGIIIYLTIIRISIYNIKKTLKIKNYKNIDIIIICLTVLLLPILYYISIHYAYRPGWDIDIVLKNIEYIMTNNTDKIMHGYYSRYANNLFLTYIFLNIYKLSKVIGIYNGYFLLLFIQSIIFSVGGYLIYKIADMYFKERYKIYSVCTWIIYMTIVGLSPHIVLTYSDGIGMFLSLVLTYIIFKLEDRKILKNKKEIIRNRILKTILILFFTNLTIISYYIKPQIIIVSIAYGIIKLTNIILSIIKKYIIKLKTINSKKIINNKNKIQTNIYYIIIILLIMLTGYMTYTYIRKANNSMGIDVDKEKRFNITHYAMLGWNTESKGVFTIKDENFSGKYEKLKDREKANIEELKKRITEMGIGGVINQIARKILTNYNDGTFSGVATFVYIRDEYNIQGLDNNLSEFLKNVYYERGKYNQIYTQIMQCLWISILIFNMFSYNDSKSRKIAIIILALIGLFLFETIFEARSRYIFVYVPLYIFIGVIGIKNVLNWTSRRIKCIKNRKNVILCIGKK